MQESTGKDVERCFGILQSKFGIIANPCRLWSIEAMKDVMLACVILKNMIIEDERSEDDLEPLYEMDEDVEIPSDLSFWTLKGKTTY
jgi:hypothetical protein